MRFLKTLLIGLLLMAPGLAAANSNDIPGSAVWYFHLDLEQMRSAGPGQSVYGWLQDDAFEGIFEESGVDLDKELDRMTAFSLDGQGAVILFEGDISQETKDKVMVFLAAGGDLEPREASGSSYYHFRGEPDDDRFDYADSNLEVEIESLQNEAWISMDLKKKLLITGSEEQMRAMLARNGKIAGSNGHGGALLVLTAEKTMLQASMDSSSFSDGDGDSGWESNILRNTEQVAFMMAAAADKLAFEATLITSEPDMANSLASVVRGLISLMAFSDDMDAEAIAVLQGTKVEAVGNNLSISIAIDPDLVVETIGD